MPCGTHIQQQIAAAIEASEKILLALDEGSFDCISALDETRKVFIRSLAKISSPEEVWQNYASEIKKIVQLDKHIVNKTEQLRYQVLTEILNTNNSSTGCLSYLDNQRSA